MVNVVKADKTADFEMIVGKLQEALQKSARPERAEQAAGWRVYKASEPGPSGSVMYVFLIDPVVKDTDYTPSTILAEGGHEDVRPLYKALSEGKDVLFTRIAVVADTDDPTPPCGSCRQLLWEYCGDIEVILSNLSEVKRRLRLSQLLPLPFDARLLE